MSRQTDWSQVFELNKHSVLVCNVSMNKLDLTLTHWDDEPVKEYNAMKLNNGAGQF